MSFLTGDKPVKTSKTKIGLVVRATGGILKGKYGMIAKVFPKTEENLEAGYGIYVDASDWPSEIPTSFNAIFVREIHIVELSEEEQTLLKLKFPNPDQFE